MTSNPDIPVSPFLDEVFFNSPLCQICEFASIFGSVCLLLLNRRLPVSLIVKKSQVVSCSAHRNWIQSFKALDESAYWETFDDQEIKNGDENHTQDTEFCLLKFKSLKSYEEGIISSLV